MRIRLQGFFWPKPASPYPLPVYRGTAEIEGPVLPQERRIFSPPSSLPFYIPPPLLSLPPFLSLISLSGTQSASASQCWVHQFIKEALAQMNRASEVFSPAPWGSRRCAYGRQRAWHHSGKTPKGVELSPDLGANTKTCVHKPATRRRVRADVRQGVSQTNPWPKFWNWGPIRNMCTTALVRLPFLLKRHIWWINSGKQRPTVVSLRSLLVRHSRVLLDVIDSCQARPCTLVNQ